MGKTDDRKRSGKAEGKYRKSCQVVGRSYGLEKIVKGPVREKQVR